MKMLNKILSSIIALPLALIGAVLIIPFISLYYLIAIPVWVLSDIWNDQYGE